MNFDKVDRVFFGCSLGLCVFGNRVVSEHEVSFGGISVIELGGNNADYVHHRKIELNRFHIVLLFDVIKIKSENTGGD